MDAEYPVVEIVFHCSTQGLKISLDACFARQPGDPVVLTSKK